MALHWLGFVKPVVDVPPVALDGPDPLTSAAYARDYKEVRRVGAVERAPRTGPRRRPPSRSSYGAQRDLGLPGGAVRRARRGADGAAADDAAVRADRRRRGHRVHPDVAAEVRRRLLAAVPGDRGRRRPTATRRPTRRPAWAPLIPNPAYSDYTSGHAAATSPFAEVVRQTLGDDTPLVLKSRALSGPTPHSPRSSTTPCTPGSGVDCTSVTPWRTATTWATRRPTG